MYHCERKSLESVTQDARNPTYIHTEEPFLHINLSN